MIKNEIKTADMVRFTIRLPKDIHHDLRIYCFEQGMPMQKYVSELIKADISKQRAKEKESETNE
ncbi:MAG: hypothetical protein IJ583_17775 [Firmicutes bacterium]|nr:hypothetical protein [Bacillota bacterium]